MKLRLTTQDPVGMAAALCPGGVQEAWARIALFVGKPHAREERFACPECGYRAALSVRVRAGRKPLLYCFAGCPQATLYTGLNHASCTDWTPASTPGAAVRDRHSAENRERALKLWAEATAVSGTIAEVYLATRKISYLAVSEALRFHEAVSHPTAGTLPAMVALVVDPGGSPQAVLRTYLRPDGSGKALIEIQKASLGPVSGGLIKLTSHLPHRPLVIGEGIETAASAGTLLNAPAWSAISAGNLGRDAVLPAVVEDVIIAVDADGPGLKAAASAAKRWRDAGKRVEFACPGLGMDCNDLLVSNSKEGRHG